MSDAFAKLFKTGRSQAVRLPKEFRLPGDRVRIRRQGSKVILEPLPVDLQTWWAELDRLGRFDIERNQPPMPCEEDFFP